MTPDPAAPDPPIRDAATIILMRDPATRPRMLMGQRGASAAFMPNKVVFPGGAVDPGDVDVPLAAPLPALCAARLTGDGPAPEALAAAAIRELWEETGLALGRPGRWDAPPPAWRSFAEAGLRPDPAPLRFVFRAITPRGRSRRFDARFFLCDAAAIAGDVDDFSGAEDELSHLRWIDLADARQADLPFITTIVLAEIAARLPSLDAPETVPFFQNEDEDIAIRRLGAR